MLTGSSARLLSREIASTLRGRSITTEIFPFSFREVPAHREIDSDLSRPPGGQRRALYANRLHQYLLRGGFPEVQGVEEPYRRQILQEYVDVVILRNVVERHGVGNIVPLRYLIRHLLGIAYFRTEEGYEVDFHITAQDGKVINVVHAWHWLLQDHEEGRDLSQ